MLREVSYGRGRPNNALGLRFQIPKHDLGRGHGIRIVISSCIVDAWLAEELFDTESATTME